MKTTFRNHTSEPFHTDDYQMVREFLVRINDKKLYTPEYLWGAWEWIVTHRDRDHDNLDKIGLWEDGAGKLVAFATYETILGQVFLVVDETYANLKPDMIAYAKKALCDDKGNLRICLPDGDYEFAHAARAQGFRPTQKTDIISILDIEKIGFYALPAGFSFISMADGWNWEQYNRVMRRGFGGEENPVWDDETALYRKRMLSSPMINPELVVAVMAPDGSYVSHCGLWHIKGEFCCYVEPVVTDPDYQKMGLGKAAVFEAVSRAAKLGAYQAVVASSRQFYYNIGFYPIKSITYWELAMEHNPF
ncbi:MAG: GNAT family N-acetyltransferase [Defluviitaleaceae bacterium]|nr:GNAT family N-acetyltransferase [Defluviitaleaceae bacterium]